MNHPITLYDLLCILRRDTQVEIIRHMGGNVYDFVAEDKAGNLLPGDRKPACTRYEVQKAALHTGDEGAFLEIIISAK